MMTRNRRVLFVLLLAGCSVQTDQLQPLDGEPGEMGPPGADGMDGAPATGNFMISDGDTGTTGSVNVGGTLVSDGGVGIGTPPDTAALRVVHSSATTAGDALIALGNTDFPAEWHMIISEGMPGPAGTLRMTAVGSGVTELAVTPAGAVGVGTADPQDALHVLGSGSAALRLDNGTNGWRINANEGTGRLVFSVAGAVTSGPVKIDPDAVLDLLQVGVNADDEITVNGDLVATGTITPDYVFAPGYELESIEEHARYMWKHRHLPAVPGAATNADGVPVTNVMAQSNGTLEELEKAHIYIEQLDDRVAKLENENSALKARLASIDARLAELTADR